MRPAIKRQTLVTASAATCLLLSGCVSVSITPPLSSNGDQPSALYQGVAFTSGTFKQAHQVLGVVQMTQEGFRHYLAGELNEEGTDATQMMHAIARFAIDHGADGIQQFSLIDENPRSQEERSAQQVGQSLKLLAAIATQNKEGYQTGIHDGEQTRYFIKGELIAWRKSEPSQSTPNAESNLLNKEDNHPQPESE